MRRKQILPGLWLLALGCIPNLQLPESGDWQITCTDSSDCPQGSTCTPSGRCVSDERTDFDAPTLDGAVVIEPAVVGRPGRVLVSFRVSEPLGGVPWARAVRAGVSVDLEPVTSADPSYTFAYDVTAADVEGFAAVIADFTDQAGNQAAGVQLGSFTLDFTPPGLLQSQLSKPALKAGETLHVTITPDEALDAPPTLRIVGGATLPHVAGTSYVYTLAIDGSLSDGPRSLTVDLIDRALNANEAVPAGTFSVDTSVPEVQGLDVLPEIAGAGADMTVSFMLNEDVEAAGGRVEVSFAGMLLDDCTGVGSAYTCGYQLTGAEIPVGTEAPMTVAVLASDLAGNAGAAAQSILIEFESPTAVLSELHITPAPGSLLADVEAATGGGKVLVTFVADEPAGPTPALVASLGATVLTLAYQAPDSSLTSFRFEVELPACPSLVEGSYDLALDLADRAGNDGDVLITDVFTTDCGKPDPVAAIDQAGLKHLRLPWGAEQNGYVAAAHVVPFAWNSAADPTDLLELPATAFNLAGDELRRVYFFTSSQGGVVLGSSEWTGTAWEAPALLSDSPRLYVALVDWAGLMSEERVPLEHTEWVATLGVPLGSSDANPHRLEERPVDAGGAQQPRAVVVASDAGAEQVGDGTLTTQGTMFTQRLPAPSVPGERGYMVYDTWRGRAVQFGGDGPTESCGASCTWAYANGRWDRLNVTDPQGDESPPAGFFQFVNRGAMVYDEARDRVVLVPCCGGLPTCGGAGCLWEFDGESWAAKTPLDAGDGVPTMRAWFGLAYDARREQVLLFGGEDTTQVCPGANQVCGDFWSYDGTSWDRLTWTGPGPQERRYGSMAYDRERDRLVLFGGQVRRIDTNTTCDGVAHVNGLCATTWEWDGAAWQAHGGAGPNACLRHELVYDARLARVLLMGGRDRSSGVGICNSEQLWSYDDAGWSVVAVADAHGDGEPIFPNLANYPFDDHRLYYDADRERVVYVSHHADPEGGQTWELDGSSWGLRTPRADTFSVRPLSRSGAAATYSPEHGGLVLYGGEATFGGPMCDGATRCCDDLWVYDGEVWVDVTPASRPGGRNSAAIAAWPSLGKLYVFGGRLVGTTSCDGFATDELWQLEGGTFTLVGTGPPPARWGASLTLDPVRNVLVLFAGQSGGFALPDLWEFDGALWAQRCDGTPFGDDCPVQPTGRSEHGAVYEPTLGGVLVFGGRPNTPTLLQDTWLWSGTAWTRLDDGSSGVAGREFGSLVYDARRARAVQLGGTVHFSEAQRAGEVWEYDPATGWSPMIMFDPYLRAEPLAGMDRPAVYLPGRDRVVLFDAGFDGWTLERDPLAPPAHVATFATESLGVPFADVEPLAMTVTVIAGADGLSYESPLAARLHDGTVVSLPAGSFTTATTPALARFDGVDAEGTWTLHVRRFLPSIETFMVDDWCLGGLGAGPDVCQGYATRTPRYGATHAELPISGAGAVSSATVSLVTTSTNDFQRLAIDVAAPHRALNSAGVTLSAYTRSGWRTLGVADAPSTAPALVEIPINDPALIRALLTDNDEVRLRIRPAPNTVAPGTTLVTDYVELRLLVQH